MEFRFKEQEKVKVVRKGLQYATYWKGYGKLLDNYNFSVAHRPYIIGTELNGIPEDTEFVVLSRDYISTTSGYRNLYLIAPKRDLEEREQTKGVNRFLSHLYVVDESALEEYFKMNVWFCEYKPVNGKIYVNPKCTEEDMKKNGFPLDTVNETERKSYYVHVKAIDSCDAIAKAKKLFTEYFSKLWDKRSAETKRELQEISDNLYKVQHLNE